MPLPKKINNQSGQVLVIFLLVLVIGLALVLSIASRTVTDVRQTTTSDESNRAYYAAESGVEDALKKLESNPSLTGALPILNLTSVNNSQATVQIDAYPTQPSDGHLVDFFSYSKDDVAQIVLMSDFNNLGSAGSGVVPANTITFHYGASAVVALAPALEVSFITYDGTNWGIKKMVFDQNAGNVGHPNVCKPSGGTPVGKYKFSVSVGGSNPVCGNNEPLPGNLVLARVRFLYSDSPLGVTVTGHNLPQQGHLIKSTGSTPSGVSRKLENTRFYPTLPGLFDYVLYNGSGTGDLCKGSSC